jgi:hypothetical protein
MGAFLILKSAFEIFSKNYTTSKTTAREVFHHSSGSSGRQTVLLAPHSQILFLALLALLHSSAAFRG